MPHVRLANLAHYTFLGSPLAFLFACVYMTFMMNGVAGVANYAAVADRPRVTVPRAMRVSLLLVVVTYALICVADAGALPIAQIANQDLAVSLSAFVPAPVKQSSGSPATQTAKPSTGNTTAQQSQPAQSTGTQSGQSTTGSTAGITGDAAANANADAPATQTSKDAASRKNSDDNTADTAGGETATTEAGITDSGTDTAETTTQASPVTDRAETTSPVVRIVAGVVIALAVIGTLGAALIARNKRRAPALAGANGGRSDDGFDIADGATPAPATTANAIAATEARADASAPTEVLQPIASPANGPSAGPSASLNVADSGGAPTARYDFNLVDGPSSR